MAAVISLAISLVLCSFLLSFTVACEDSDHPQRHFPPQASSPIISRPVAPLVWGDINVLHTTDTHGWLGGHKKDIAPEPNYSGDLGTFSSFITHMKAEAERRNVDLLLVDSGDMHDGNGLTDGFPSGGINGEEALKIFAQLPYDVLAIGNHELYKYNVAHDVHKNFAPKWNGRYLTSNVNITVSNENNQSTSIPLGARYAKFKTRLGRSVTALGVLFDFKMNSANTTVQPVADMIKEHWFREAISDEPDIFLLVGHMPVQKDKWPVVFSAIRAVHPQTPILIFGGHSHIRDCVQLDERSMSLASGRYMETIGWMSAKLDETGSTDDLVFNRRYLDANQVTYSYHTGKYNDEFHTYQGQSITASVQALSDRFNLSYQFGIAPNSYFMERVPVSSPQSIVSFFVSQVLPTVFSISNPRASVPRMIVTNSGGLRSDLYAGPFTRDDQFIVSPFTDSYEYLENVSYNVANRILDELNHSGLPSRLKRGPGDNDIESPELLGQGDSSVMYASIMYERWMWEQWERWNMEQHAATNLTLGYVTKDACPGEGDDVPHTPLPHYVIPPFAGPSPANNDTLDLVYGTFIRNSVLQMVNILNEGSKPNVTMADAKPYTDVSANEAIGIYASVMWN